MFEFLSANEWVGGGCNVSAMFPPTCHRLRLKADGAFDWSAFSDYPEREDDGQWNFVAHDADSGTIFFSTGDSVLFSREGEGLSTSRTGFAPGGAQATAGSFSDLPEVAPPPLYTALSGTCWKQTNDFDRYRIPSQIVLGEAGNFLASYRDGECEHAGRFAVDAGSLVASSDGNLCDLRGTPGVLPGYNPEFVGELFLVDQASYRPLSSTDDETLFVADSWRMHPDRRFRPEGASSGFGSVRVTGRYRDALVQGSATPVSFEIKNVSAGGVKLRSFSLVLTPLERTDNAFASAGEPHWLPFVDFAGARLAPGESVSLDSEILSGVWGDWVNAQFALTFTAFDGEDFTNQVSYLVPISEGEAIPITPPPDPVSETPGTLPPSYSSCGTLQIGAEVHSLAFSPDGSSLAVGSTQGNVGLWDGESLVYSVPGVDPPNQVYAVAFAGDVLASVHQSQINRFEASSGQSLGALGEASDASGSWLLTLASGADGARLASGDFAGNVNLWQAADGTLERSLVAHHGQVFALAFAPDGTLATGGADQLVKLWNPDTGELLRTFEEHTDWIGCVAFGEEGALLATGGMDESVVLWNLADASIRRVIDLSDDVFDCRLTPEGTLVLQLSNAVALYRSDDGGGPLLLPFDDIVRAMAVAPDGETLAVGGWTGKVEFFCRD